MDGLPAFGLANTATGFATLFAGATGLGLSRLLRRQPPAWERVWLTVAITGIFTVTLHGFGETAPGFGPRWFWAFLDTGSNIVVAWAVGMAALSDYYEPAAARRGGRLLTAAMLAGIAWHFVDRLPGTERHYLIPLGTWGGFYPGESCLIALSLAAAGLFAARRGRMPPRARPLLASVLALFTGGMLLATARNDLVVAPFLPLHALWHVVGAFAFVFLWAFEHACLEGAGTATDGGGE